MSAAVARRANTTSKAMGGKASFFVALVEVFFGWRNVEMRVRVDGEERRAMFNNTVVANGQYHGGGMWLAPEARPDDGLFDVLVFGDLTKTDFVRNVGKIYRGTHLSHPKIEQLRGARVEIDADEPLPIELDGEQPGTTPARFEIVPRALRVRVPARRSSCSTRSCARTTSCVRSRSSRAGAGRRFERCSTLRSRASTPLLELLHPAHPARERVDLVAHRVDRGPGDAVQRRQRKRAGSAPPPLHRRVSSADPSVWSSPSKLLCVRFRLPYPARRAPTHSDRGLPRRGLAALAAGAAPPPATTLGGTIVDRNGDGRLDPGPGRATPRAGRARRRPRRPGGTAPRPALLRPAVGLPARGRGVACARRARRPLRRVARRRRTGRRKGSSRS